MKDHVSLCHYCQSKTLKQQKQQQQFENISQNL